MLFLLKRRETLPTSSEYVIELNEVWKKYSLDLFHRSLRADLTNIFNSSSGQDLKEREFWALKDINIKAKKGNCLGIYGPNGSGKTTILKIIASVTYPNKGEAIVRKRVAPLIAVSAGFHPDLTGEENIYTNGTIIGMSIKEIKNKMDQIIEFSEIDRKFFDLPVKKFSSGMSARLGFSIAVYSSSDIILIDEILSVGDESFRLKSFDKIKELTRSDKTIIIVSHNLERLKGITDRIIYLNKGEITSSQ